MAGQVGSWGTGSPSPEGNCFYDGTNSNLVVVVNSHTKIPSEESET